MAAVHARAVDRLVTVSPTSAYIHMCTTKLLCHGQRAPMPWAQWSLDVDAVQAEFAISRTTVTPN
eukprot:889230-Amphidinium_carterae.1